MIDTVAKAGVSVDPTLVAYDSKFSDPRSPRYRRNRHVEVVPEMHADWKACTTIARDWMAEDYARWRAAWPKALALVGTMHRRGILMTTGTDITNPWVIPGESLHQEFELLNQAGIPPLEILRMTGANAAKAMGLEDVGIIDVGRRADLILLNADPRQDISNTRQIAWVMQGGRLVSRPAGRAKHIPVPAKRH
jgi:imidazolonepropionase-like amidohydrolase